MSAFGRFVPAGGSPQTRLMLLAQLSATAAVLGWVPGNVAKLAAMVAIWRLSFGRLTAHELIMMAAVNLLFVLMNFMALRRGIFVFDHPDLLRMPIYEYLMWSFYTLHTIRLLDGAPPRGRIIPTAAAAAAFALPFAMIAEPKLLLLASAAGFGIGIAMFHEKMDLAYAAYMAALGALIEYVGVSTGQWHYPGQPYGGVPLWFLTMWAGIGLFTRRLVLPLLPPSRGRPLLGGG
jgi:hypothetical protein